MLDKIAHIALEPAAEPARKRSVSEDYAVAADLPLIPSKQGKQRIPFACRMQIGDMVVPHQTKRNSPLPAKCCQRLQTFPMASNDCEASPIAGAFGLKHIQPLQFSQRQSNLLDIVTGHLEHMNPAFGNWIPFGILATGGLIASRMVDAQDVIGLHPFPCARDHLVGAVDDVLCRSIVLDQMEALRLIITFELPNEADVGPTERVDILVIVANDNKRQSVLLGIQRASGHRTDQREVVGIHVLIFIDKKIAQASEHTVPLNRGSDVVSLLGKLQHLGGCLDHRVELDRLATFCGHGIARPRQAQGQAVERLDTDACSIWPDQRPKAAFNLDCC